MHATCATNSRQFTTHSVNEIEAPQIGCLFFGVTMSKNQNVLVLGGASWNTMIYLDHLPDGKPKTIADAQFHDGAGSTGIGKAFALKQFEYDPTLHIVIGDDERGKKITAECEGRGISLTVDYDHAPTPQHFNLMDKDGQRISIFRENGSADPQVRTDRLAPIVAKADTIFLNITASSVPVLPLLEGTKAKVFVDLHDYDGQNPWHQQFIEHANMVQLSDEQLAQPEAVVQQLVARGIELVVLTRGKEGATLYTKDECIEIAPVKANVKDANGAGDTFAIALWHALQDGHSLADSGRFAASAASLCVESTDIVPKNLSSEAVNDRLNDIRTN